tara:strand:+ start:1641 stop:2234 length:594 start_codon:yes stop_codon:yes gene_type:complete
VRLEAIRNYLEQSVAMASSAMAGMRLPAGWQYFNAQDFVLDRGKNQPENNQVTPEQYAYLKTRDVGVDGFEQKQCFYNAQRLILADHEGRFEYWEGYAYTGVIPVLHAWVVFEGSLVDVTRSIRPEATFEFFEGKKAMPCLTDRVLGIVPKHWRYYGVKFDSNYVREVVLSNCKTMSLIDCPDEGWPVLRWDRENPR